MMRAIAKTSAVSRRTSWVEWASWMIGLALALLASACATTGATLGSGVGEKYFDRPPYFTGAQPPQSAELIAHLPIAYQRGAVQAAFFEPDSGEGSPVSNLLQEMNAFLDSLRVSPALEITELARFTPPDVRFGCEAVSLGDCEADSEDIAVQGKPWMLMAVGRPSPEWTSALAGALEQAGKEYALVLTLEVGQYWVRQRNLLGAKVVRLGTAHEQDVPWLTSLDQPVQVVQLTGALVGADGRAIRIGAEGIFARRTNIVLSGFGAQELITDEDIERLRTLRRDDLYGEPLAWQIAVGNVVAELTGDPLLRR